MTATVNRPGTRPAYVVRDHILTGEAAQMRNVVELHETAGTLVALGTPRRLDDGRYRVRMRLVEPAPARVAAPRPQPEPRPIRVQVRSSGRTVRRVVITAGAVTTGLAAVGYLLSIALRMAVTAVTTHVPFLVGVLAALFVLTVIFGGAKACSGTHCGGCRRH